MKESYLAECLEKFHELPDQLQEMIGGLEACSKIKKIEEVHGVSLSFATILIAIGELTIDDLTDYLNLKFKLNKTQGEKITEALSEEIFTPAFDLVVENIPSLEESENNQTKSIIELSAVDKKELILKTFSGGIIPALQANPAKLQDFNVAIFQTFETDENLYDEMERLLYINQEKLSEHQIVLDGHPASPTIANWLKDFIKKYGSDIFNEVTLAEYLSQSPNIKQIKPEEKELVRKILKLYRNLVFFPESMEGVIIEHWEIFPFDQTKINSFRDILSDENKVISKITEEPIITGEPVISERQKIIFDLQKSLTKYSTSSLEYKAIHQEINRLSRK